MNFVLNVLKGKLLESLNMAVLKVMLVREVGKVQRERVVGLGDGSTIPVVDELPKYRVVGTVYLDWSQTLFNYGQGAYEISLDDQAYQRREVYVHFVDVDSGKAVLMGGGQVFPRKHPLPLSAALAVGHVKAAVSVAKGLSANWVWLLLGGVMGGAIGFIVAGYV